MTEEKLPVWTFLTEYFPDAFEEVVRVAVSGNAQHENDGPTIKWDRSKSPDHMNKALRHMLKHARGKKLDTDGRAHIGKAIWRLSAQLQLDIEAARSKEPKPGTVTAVCGNIRHGRVCSGVPGHHGHHGDGVLIWTETDAEYVYDESGLVVGRTGP
jgi:hypothetical protein